jgi:hypothetical protein
LAWQLRTYEGRRARVLHRRLAQPDSLPIKPTRPVQAAPDPHKPEENPQTADCTALPPPFADYASAFMLQDHMFEPDATWSLPAHLFLVSGWEDLPQLADLRADFDFTKPPRSPLLPPPNNP